MDEQNKEYIEELVFSAGLENGAFTVICRRTVTGLFDFLLRGSSFYEDEDGDENETPFDETASDLKSLFMKIRYEHGWIPLPHFNPINVNPRYAEELWLLFAELEPEAWAQRHDYWQSRGKAT